MITFIGLNIEGFCSYEGKTYIDLNENKTILIKAPNGFGKSTIFSALVWVLYGKNLKGNSDVNTWKEVRSKSYKGTKVDITFNKGDHTYLVTRCQNYISNLDDGAKGKDRLLIYKDAELISIKGKTALQEFLINELGLTYKLFINSIMFGQGIERLIQESNSDKKKIFEEVFNLNFLNIAKNIAIDMKNEIYQEVREIEYQYNSISSELESTKETYEDLKHREKSFKEDKERRLIKLNKSLKDYKRQVKDLGNSKSDINLVESKLNDLRKSLNLINKKLEDARNISNIPLIDVVSKVITLLDKGKVDKALINLKKIKSSFEIIEKYNDKKDSIHDKITIEEREKSKLYKVKSQINSLNDRIDDIKEQISEIKSEKINKLSPKYRDKLSKLKDNLLSVRNKLDKSKDKLSDVEWLISEPLSNKGIKAYLFNSSLDLLNDTLERYSKILGFRISFDIDLESTKKDFITLIERNDIIIDYDDLSGGEKQLANVAMAFAMNESLTASKGINIAFLDEVFESLDSENIDLVVSLVNTIYEDKTLFLITHQESLPLSNCKILQVKKENDISTCNIL